ncbi:MAG: putative phosphoribosyl transferase [Actinomycetota bacterium]
MSNVPKDADEQPAEFIDDPDNQPGDLDEPPRDKARFVDRMAAGIELAEHLERLGLTAPVVLALPMGGVPVAAAIADRLHAPLDILEVHEITAATEDLGVGAVAVNEEDVHRSAAVALGVTPHELDEKVERGRAALREVVADVRAQRPAQPLDGCTAIVVDDALAVTHAAAAAAFDVRARGAARSVLAVPAGVATFIDALSADFDDIVCLERVGRLERAQWYDELPAVELADVVRTITSSTP